MTDSNYIPPSELDRYRPMIHHETGERTPGDIGLSNLMLLQVIESHAVVDSIAAELADALRKVRDRYYNQSGVRSGGAESPSSIGFAALERFDNLTKGTE